MNILATINANYLKPLQVMLKSLFINNSQEDFHVYLIHSSLKEEELATLEKFIASHNHQLRVITIPEGYFNDAPILMHYTKRCITGY